MNYEQYVPGTSDVQDPKKNSIDFSKLLEPLPKNFRWVLKIESVGGSKWYLDLLLEKARRVKIKHWLRADEESVCWYMVGARNMTTDKDEIRKVALGEISDFLKKRIRENSKSLYEDQWIKTALGSKNLYVSE